MPNAFNNTNQNQFGNMNFTDWSQVADTFGTSVVNALQQNNVPLDQVGSTIGKLGVAQQVTPGQQFGAANPQFVSSGFTLADAINQQQGGGGGSQQQQGPSFDPTQNPNYPLSLLGAQALNAVGLNPSKQVTVNPTPANTPSSSQFAKSGVSSVASPMTTTYTQANPTTQTPSVFTSARDLGRQNGINWAPKPTAQVQTGQQWLNTQVPKPPVTGTNQVTNQSFAGVQAPQINVPPAAPAPTGPIPEAVAHNWGIPMVQPAYTGYTSGEPIPQSAGTIAQQNVAMAAAPKHMASGGPVDTDTVPAMLTPGEYVIKKSAAKKIGEQKLDKLNQGRGLGSGLFEDGVQHKQEGGNIEDMENMATSYAMSQFKGPQQAQLQQLIKSGQIGASSNSVAQQFLNLRQKFISNQLGTQWAGPGGTPTPSGAPKAATAATTQSAQTTSEARTTAPAAPQTLTYDQRYPSVAGQGNQVRGGGMPPVQQPQQQNAYPGTINQWLAQYGHTPQGQAWLGQNQNSPAANQYLASLQSSSGPGSPLYGNPQGLQVGPQVGPQQNQDYAPRAQLVGLPAGEGPAYDPKTYGIQTTGQKIGSGVASAAGAISQVGQDMINNAVNQLGRIQPARNTIPAPNQYAANQAPALRGSDVGLPNQAAMVMQRVPRTAEEVAAQGGYDSYGWASSYPGGNTPYMG